MEYVTTSQLKRNVEQREYALRLVAERTLEEIVERATEGDLAAVTLEDLREYRESKDLLEEARADLACRLENEAVGRETSRESARRWPSSLPVTP